MSSNTQTPIQMREGKIESLKNMTEYFFRYVPLIGLYVVSLIFLFNHSTQFILFICIFVLTIFGMIFIIRDLFAISKVYTCIFGVGTDKCDGYTSIIVKLLMFALVIGLFQQFISLAIIIAVFDYGRQTSTKNFLVKKMSGGTNMLLYNYKEMLIASSSITIILAFFMAFSYGIKTIDSDKAQNFPMFIMRDIGCGALSLGLLGITSYEMYLSTLFLKIKEKKSQLYIV